MKRGKKPTKSKLSTEAAAPWRQCVVDAAASFAEPLEGVLVGEGALGTERIDDTTRSMPGRPVAPTGRVTLIAPFSAEPGLEARVVKELGRVTAILEEHLGPSGLEIAWADLWPEDWNAAFKAQWKPLAVSERVWIAPTWEEGFSPPAGAVCLRLDPGLAFGTGTHPTTQLCARALEEACEKAPPGRLLDVGTGTGILALLALLLGVEEARGTDIDPVALRAARENAEQNGLARRFTTTEAEADADGPVWPAVVANILAGPLIELAPRIAGAVAPGGQLWLSGILEDQAGAVERAYLAQGLESRGRATQEGWVRLDLRKPTLRQP